MNQRKYEFYNFETNKIEELTHDEAVMRDDIDEVIHDDLPTKLFTIISYDRSNMVNGKILLEGEFVDYMEAKIKKILPKAIIVFNAFDFGRELYYMFIVVNSAATKMRNVDFCNQLCIDGVNDAFRLNLVYRENRSVLPWSKLDRKYHLYRRGSTHDFNKSLNRKCYFIHSFSMPIDYLCVTSVHCNYFDVESAEMVLNDTNLRDPSNWIDRHSLKGNSSTICKDLACHPYPIIFNGNRIDIKSMNIEYILKLFNEKYNSSLRLGDRQLDESCITILFKFLRDNKLIYRYIKHRDFLINKELNKNNTSVLQGEIFLYLSENCELNTKQQFILKEDHVKYLDDKYPNWKAVLKYKAAFTITGDNKFPNIKPEDVVNYITENFIRVSKGYILDESIYSYFNLNEKSLRYFINKCCVGYNMRKGKHINRKKQFSIYIKPVQPKEIIVKVKSNIDFKFISQHYTKIDHSKDDFNKIVHQQKYGRKKNLSMKEMTKNINIHLSELPQHEDLISNEYKDEYSDESSDGESMFGDDEYDMMF